MILIIKSTILRFMKIKKYTIIKSIYYILSKLIMFILFLPLFIIVLIASFIKVITEEENKKQSENNSVS